MPRERPLPNPSAGRVRSGPAAIAAAIAHLLARGGAHPLLDRPLGRLLAYPRALQATAILIGALVSVLSLRPLLLASSAGAGSVAARPSAAAPSPAAVQEVLAVVAAYNQASIAAAALGRVDLLAPTLAPDGAAWAAAQTEYARRNARDERHTAALVRWGVLRTDVTGTTAIVETQEEWDDLTEQGSQVISSRRGLLTHNRYTLRRATTAASWQIRDVTTIVVMG